METSGFRRLDRKLEEDEEEDAAGAVDDVEHVFDDPKAPVVGSLALVDVLDVEGLEDVDRPRRRRQCGQA